MSDGKDLPNFDLIKSLIEDQMKKKPNLQITIPDNYYDTVKHHMELITTGEEINVDAKVASLTTLYQTLAAKGDPRADQVLEKIMGYTGENLESMLGSEQPLPQPQPPQGPQSPGQTQPGQTQPGQMNRLAMSNAPAPAGNM